MGTFPHTSDEFHYRWVSDIIRIETGIEKNLKLRKLREQYPNNSEDLRNKYVERILVPQIACL